MNKLIWICSALFCFASVSNAQENETKAEKTPSQAEESVPLEPKTLISNGLYADGYADFAVQSISILDENTTQLAIKAGWNFWAPYYFAITAGYGISSLGSLSSQSRDFKRYTYNYHGPVAELMLFPRSRFYAGFIGYWARGTAKFRKEKDDPTTKASMQIREASFGIYGKIRHLMHAGVQVGQHHVNYNDRRNFTNEDKDSSIFYSLSFRASTL